MKITILIALGLLLIGCSENSKTESIKQVVEKKKNVEQKIVVKEVVKKEVVVKEKTGKDIFMTCAACHGQNAEKIAMGKSKVIRGWKPTKILTALNGYKAGTYGGVMKGLMKAQVSSLTDADMNNVAEYISKL